MKRILRKQLGIKRIFAALMGALMLAPILPMTTFAADAELTADGNGGYYVTMPVSGTDTLDLTDQTNGFSFHVYDDGGAGGNYANYSNGQITIKAPENMVLAVSGSGKTEYGYDYLKFYNGAGNTSPLLGSTQYTGNFDIGEPLTTDGNYLTIYFHSDSSGNDSGFQLTVTLFTEISVNYVFDGNTERVAARKDTTINLADFDDLFESYDKEFICWQNGDDTYDEGDSYFASEDVTFTAVTRQKPTVTFDGNGAVFLYGDGETVSYPMPFHTGTTAPLPHANEIFHIPENKYFGGWLYNDRTYAVGEAFTLTENVTFTAIWRDASAWDLLNESLQVSAGTNLGIITLTEDLTAPIGSFPLTVPEGVAVTIDLGGHALSGVQAAALDGNAMYAYGSLTLTDSGNGTITGGNIISYENGAVTLDDSVRDNFTADLTQSYVVEDVATDEQTEHIYSVSYCPTIDGAMKAAALEHAYEDSITTLPADPNSYYFWYNDSRIALLKDVTIAQNETLEVNAEESIWLDLNGHTFDVQGTFTGGTQWYRYENDEQIPTFYPTNIQIVSENTGVFRASGTIDVTIQPWTEDTYYITGGTINGFIGADGGTFHISGGHFTNIVMFNNGNEEANLEIDLSGDAEFDRLEHMIYAYDDAPQIHMSISDNVRVKAMLFEIMGNSVVTYPVLTINGGYFTVDPSAWYETAGAGENAVWISDIPEQYNGQTDWAADSGIYTWRIPQESGDTSVSLSGEVSGNVLTYKVANAPKGAKLIAARYDGRELTDLQVVRNPRGTKSLTMQGAGTHFELFLWKDFTTCKHWASR